MTTIEEGSVASIVVADDEPNVRLLVGTLLGAAGHAVIEARDGEEAWDLLREHRPPLAVLDVSMPGLSGLELARAIRGEASLARTRVILLTALAQAAEREAGLAAGADMYLTKPFSPVQLLAAVDRALGA